MAALETALHFKTLQPIAIPSFFNEILYKFRCTNSAIGPIRLQEWEFNCMQVPNFSSGPFKTLTHAIPSFFNQILYKFHTKYRILVPILCKKMGIQLPLQVAKLKRPRGPSKLGAPRNFKTLTPRHSFIFQPNTL